MIIQTGFNSPSTLDSIELIRVNGKRVIDIYLYDANGNLVDIDETMYAGVEPSGILNLEVTDLSNVLVYSESYWPVTLPDERRIKHLGTGHYGIKWGEAENETSSSGTLLFNWNARVNKDSEEFFRTQITETVSGRVLSLLPRFRLMLDKSIKVINPEQFCNLGYSDSQLIMYLNCGKDRINQAQPYVTWMTLDQFPIEHGSELLMSSSLISALESQYLFAVDTDVQSFSDQGHSFVLTHFAPIKSLYDTLSSSLPQRIREFKLHYVQSGTVMTEFRIGWGFWQTVASSPPGTYFRNHYSNTMGM